jgi:hypothetical protein
MKENEIKELSIAIRSLGLGEGLTGPGARLRGGQGRDH